jgi:hypothetical protein
MRLDPSGTVVHPSSNPTDASRPPAHIYRPAFLVNLQFRESRFDPIRISSKRSSAGLALTWPLSSWRHVVEPNQIDIFTFTVLRNLEQIDDTKETRFASQLWSDIRKTDRLDGIHFDLTFFHTIPVAHLDVGTFPYSDTASDLSPTNSLAKPLGKYHEDSLHSA